MKANLRYSRAIVLAGSLLVCLTCASQNVGTLEKIRTSGSITLGHAAQAFPFSFVSESVPTGYSVEICHKIVEIIKNTLDLNALEVKYMRVSGQARFAALLDGRIDMECGAATNNEERQQRVAFAPTTFVASIRLGARKSSKINSIGDLAGKPVLATSGSTSFSLLSQINNQRGLGILIIPTQNLTEALTRLDRGEVLAYVDDDVLLQGLFAGSSTPEAYSVSTEALSVEPYGIMFRKNDEAFKGVVTRAVTNLLQSGAIQTIYNKWFLQPVPPSGINLNLPMSAAMSRLLLQPTSSSDPADYR